MKREQCQAIILFWKLNIWKLQNIVLWAAKRKRGNNVPVAQGSISAFILHVSLPPHPPPKLQGNPLTCDVKSCCCSCLPSLKSQDLTVLSKPPVQSLVPSLEMSIQLAPSVWPWNCLIKQTRLNNDFLPELKVNTVVVLVLESVCVCHLFCVCWWAKISPSLLLSMKYNSITTTFSRC